MRTVFANQFSLLDPECDNSVYFPHTTYQYLLLASHFSLQVGSGLALLGCSDLEIKEQLRRCTIWQRFYFSLDQSKANVDHFSGIDFHFVFLAIDLSPVSEREGQQRQRPRMQTCLTRHPCSAPFPILWLHSAVLTHF